MNLVLISLISLIVIVIPSVFATVIGCVTDFRKTRLVGLVMTIVGLSPIILLTLTPIK